MSSFVDALGTLKQFESTASEASVAVLKDFTELQTTFRQYKQQIFDHLSEPSARLVALAQCTFGRIAPRVRELQQSPWQLSTDAIIDAFGVATVFSDDFLRLLCGFASSGVQWDRARQLLFDTRDRRRAKINAPTGVSHKREWVPQDVRDAMAMASVKVVPPTKRPTKRRADALHDKQQPTPPPPTRRRRLSTTTTEKTPLPRAPPVDVRRHTQTSTASEEGDVDAHGSERRSNNDDEHDGDNEEHGKDNNEHGEDGGKDDGDDSAASLEIARFAADEPDEPDEPLFHPSPLLDYQSDDSDLAPGCEGAGFDLDAMEAAEPKPSPGAFSAPPSPSSASLAASLHLPDAGKPQEDQLTPCKSPVAQAGAQPARPPSRPSPRPTKHISDGLQDPPTPVTQLRNPTAPPDLAQPKHVGADGPSGSAITHPELALADDAQVTIAETSTSLEHPHTRALQQLQDDKWLGDEAMEKIIGPLRTADVAIFEVASPPTHDWRAWAQSHRLKLLPSQATVLIPLYQPAVRHWVLLHLDLPSASVTLYNSMSAHTDPADARTVGSAIISALGVDADSRAWTFTARSPVPLQDGFLDCGVFVLVFALYALISRQLPSDIDPRLWRRLFRRALGDVLPEKTSWLPVLPQNAQPSTLDDFVEWHKKLQVTAHAMTKLRSHAHEMAAVIALVDTQADSHLHKARATRAASEQGVLARKKALELLQTVDQLCADDAAIEASLQRRIDECKREDALAAMSTEQALRYVTLTRNLQQGARSLCADVDFTAREVEKELGIMDLVMAEAYTKLVGWMAAFRQNALSV